MNILLCVTGSVAATVTDKVIKSLETVGEVKVVATKNALRFMPSTKVFTDLDEWDKWDQDKEVLHIQLKDWADVVVIAPLSANTLAKISAGICDNLVTCIIRACPRSKAIVLAPAMNTDMWENPVTTENLKNIRERYDILDFVQPVKKELVCGTVGNGAMAHADVILRHVNRILRRVQGRNGK